MVAQLSIISLYWKCWRDDRTGMVIWNTQAYKTLLKTIWESVSERRIESLDRPTWHNNVYGVTRARGTHRRDLHSEWGRSQQNFFTSVACGCPVFYEIRINFSLRMKNSIQKDLQNYCKPVIYLSVLRLGGPTMEDIKVFWNVKTALEGVYLDF